MLAGCELKELRFQPWILAGKHSLLRTRIATTESVSLCVRMKN
jgi:hypothetical protein